MYTLLDSIKAEINLQLELADLESSQDHTLWANIHRENAVQLRRIVSRFEDGKDYHMKVNHTKGTYHIKATQTNRHLEREFPELAESAEQYNDLVKQAKTLKKLKDDNK